MITFNPITLPASKMLATMTSLLGQVRFNETLKPTDIVNDLVDSCRIDNVEFGKGIVFTFKTDILPTKTLSETSSAFTIVKPNIAQETILIDTYNFVPLSTNEILTQDALLNSNSIATFFDFTMSLLEDTEKFKLFDEVNDMYQKWIPAQATQTIAVDQIDTTKLKGQDLQTALTWNANNIATTMRKTLNNMRIKNNLFTDIKTYVDANDGTTKNVVSCISADNLKLVMNDKYWTNILANSISTLYHSEKIGEMIPTKNFVLLPENAMLSTNAKVIGWLSEKNKFALSDFYKMNLGIVDPSTGYQNTFYHYAYGKGVFKHAVGVKFIENTLPVTP